MKSELADDSFDTKFLYRYRKFIDEALNAITDGKLYFSSPKNYNDPFDSTHYIDYINLLSTVGRDLDDMDNYLKKTYGNYMKYVRGSSDHGEAFIDTENSYKKYLK